MTVDGNGFLLCWSCGHLIPAPNDIDAWPPADGERITCSSCHQLGIAASGAGGIILRRPTQLELLADAGFVPPHILDRLPGHEDDRPEENHG